MMTQTNDELRQRAITYLRISALEHRGEHDYLPAKDAEHANDFMPHEWVISAMARTIEMLDEYSSRMLGLNNKYIREKGITHSLLEHSARGADISVADGAYFGIVSVDYDNAYELSTCYHKVGMNYRESMITANLSQLDALHHELGRFLDQRRARDASAKKLEKRFVVKGRRQGMSWLRKLTQLF